MSKTPRTDDQLVRYYDDAKGIRVEYVSSRFSRQLERELAQRERERDEAVRSCHIWQKGHSDIVAERDRLLGICEFGIPSSRDRLLELLTETQND
jgi:hypothetical protein